MPFARHVLLAAAFCLATPQGCLETAGAAKSEPGKKKKVKDKPKDPGREKERLAMVAHQIEARGVKDKRVLEAMRQVPRHIFVPVAYQEEAYDDHPLPIGQGQTISQPYIVAVMSEAMELEGQEKVLEVGTGSGYQAAILSLLAKEVHTIEIVTELAESSKKVLADSGYSNVSVYAGDGYAGLPDEQPFDAIMITAAPPKSPEPLKKPVKIGGRLVLPLGTTFQNLIRIRRTSETEWKQEEVLPGVIFVPMTGKIQQ